MRISPAELVVMEVLWNEAPLAASDITKALASRDWTSRTIKTMLSRLVDKGALTAAPDGRRHLYSPLIERGEHHRDAVKGFADRLFGGRAAPMVAHLAEADGLSAEDLNDLEDLVRSLKNDH